MSEVIKQMEIKGSMATAVAFTRVIEPEAVEQIRRMLSSPAAEGSRVRIMPDVHLGKGCTIGTTMTIHDKLVPNLVGVDIGCGMYTVPLGKVELDLPRIDAAAHAIPHGFSVWEKKREDFDLTALRCYMALRDPDRLERSLGTLGGGNHFIEIDMDPDGNFYLVIHSGSRDLGRQTAEHYQNLAVELLSEKEKEEGKKEREELVRDLIEAGRKEEIQAALAQLSERRRAEALPDDLAYLTGDAMEDYLYDTAICQAFARRSREKMAEILLLSAGISPRPEGGMKTPFHTIHNYIDPRERILRKGAIAAHKGEIVLIPINMRDGAILGEGIGREDWNFSAPHGAGRLFSRARARELLSLADYQEQMRGIYTTSVSEKTLDEAPLAYKSMADILEICQASVRVLSILRPVYNFKAD